MECTSASMRPRGVQSKRSERRLAHRWRKSEEDGKMDGERITNEVVRMDKDDKRDWRLRNMFQCRRECGHMSHEDLEVFGYTVAYPGCTSMHRRTATSMHGSRIEGLCRGRGRSETRAGISR